MAQEFHCLPSDIVGVSHPVQAFFFNRAVSTFGWTVEEELEKATQTGGKGRTSGQKIAEQKRRAKLKQWLRDPDEITKAAAATKERKFRDPAIRPTKKVAGMRSRGEPESGSGDG